MPEMTDFFQSQVQECRKLSARARGKDDQEYWLRLAHRWEWLLQQKTASEVKTSRPRSPLEKRFPSGRAA